ncbi:Por secretion system C-terminal sorting domain-containing protein [Soonwooa buanensis]|uniref:Por secretion system C-terminal sorting domain-containing protein n=1 Tax=Soonwooa buanensis TaxID=619805 RepID=A0A1T5EVR2_9FLAO|nr:M4 family metallopeptidase [Soonwooa buanensis]SKB87909.1 Por secretion system C-terminal sorting domain-containing protein [Soonwooa buanensis]
MKNKYYLSVAALGIAVAFYGQEQKQDLNNQKFHNSLIEFTESNAPNFQKGVFAFDSKSTKDQLPELKFISSEIDNLGIEHYRYQQTYNGIPIEGAYIVQHVKAGKLLAQNGLSIKEFSSDIKSKSSKISESSALAAAKNLVGAKQYKWENLAEEDFLKKETQNKNASFLPKADLVYYNSGSEFKADQLRLAYKFDIYAEAPVSRKLIYVDAQNGSILGSEDLIKTLYGEGTSREIHIDYHPVIATSSSMLANTTGSAVTAYSGTQSITTDYTGSTYRLRETGRGNGIETYNLKKSTSYTNAVDFTDADNNWNNVNSAEDQYATDAHWGSEKVYDYYKNTYNRNGIDNNGMKMLSYVHYSSNYLNAYWDGSRMTYGDGDSSTTPLTSLDIVGHEMTHGVTERTSNLAYRGESGALNEAYSDILGKAVEFSAKPTTANWLMGQQIGMTFRSMSNPNQYNQPDTYKGTKWVNVSGCSPTSSNDYCGVHTNSGVLNYWFYLLTVGGAGTNDIGNSFNVTGIGIQKAAAIAYRTNTSYLGASSTYADARTYSIKSAEDLYGVGSNEANQVMNAFYAVGIGSAAGSGGTTTCTAPSTITSANITQTTATVNWSAVSGSTGYSFEYKPTSSSTWTTNSTTTTTQNLTSLTASTTYDIRVKNNCSITSSSNYTTGQFTTAASTGSCAQAYESNNTTATATPITALSTDYNAAIQVSGDIDWYKITFTTGGQATIKLSNLTHDIDLRLYNSNGTSILKSSLNAGTTAEKIQYNFAAGTYYIKVYPYSGYNANSCYSLRVEPGYTVNNINSQNQNSELTNDDIKLYPNPVVDNFTLNIPAKLRKDTTANIYDVAGNLKMSVKLTSDDQNINVARLQQGVYIVKIDNSEEPIVLKFVKK